MLKGGADMPVTLDLYEFDKNKKRDPQDRRVVDALTRYVEERGGTAAEFDWDSVSSLDETANFMFGWEGEHVAYFRCNKMRTEQGDVEIAPPHSLAELGHLRRVATGEGYQADFSFLGELKTLASLEIDTMPKDEKRFPVSWACASSLTTLGIKYDEGSMRSVPDCFQGLQELQYIWILHRQLKAMALPDWLGALPHLESLRLLGHFASIPYSLVQAGLPFSDDFISDRRGINLFHATLDEGDVSLYLSNNRELIEQFYSGDQVSEDEAIRECKVIFLGDGGVGKSSLIERVMEDTFELGKHPTDGMFVHLWDTHLKDGRSFSLRFLDFGGQEIMHSMHRCFLSGHTVYVVVCAARNDTNIDKEAARWLEQVKAYAPGCPVLLALNKADENPGISVNETNLRERFPTLKAVLKTSAAAESGEFYAGKLKDAIMDCAPSCVQALRGNEGMQRVKIALKEMSDRKDPYITAEKYRKLCEDCGITKESVQQSMLEWFRDLGVAYFYQPKKLDVRLESLRVLNPVWLTNGIYRLILRSKDKVKNGILTHDDIRDILAKSYQGDAEDVTYDAEETEFILHVMRMFEISHEMQEGRELIPMLMVKKGKELDERIRNGFQLRWEGAFLPNNLIHKLMIQKYEELDQTFMWRTGARFISAGGDCQAVAQMTDDRLLDLYVIGEEEEARREYLNGFREKIGAILRSLNLNETREYICCTVNGKEGQVAYETVVAAYKRGLAEIPIEGTGGFASPAALLKWVEKDPAQAHTVQPGMPEPQKTVSSTKAVTPKEKAETLQIYLNIGLKVLAVLIALGVVVFGGITLVDWIKILFGGK